MGQLLAARPPPAAVGVADTTRGDRKVLAGGGVASAGGCNAGVLLGAAGRPLAARPRTTLPVSPPSVMAPRLTATKAKWR